MYKVLLLFFLSASSFGFDIKNPNSLDISLGTWLDNYGQVQANSNGDTNGFEFNPYMSVATEYNFYKNTILIPELGYVFQRTSEDISKNLFFMRFDIAYPLNEYFRVRMGSSFMWQIISGDGGEDTLPNGSSTEVYYIPPDRSHAFNQTLDFGIEAIIDRMSYRVQTYIYSFNQEDDRMHTISVSANYIIPFKELLK